MQKYFEDEGINVRHNSSLAHCSIVERANRTLQGLIYKFCTKQNTWRYIDELQKLVQTYNRSFHRTIGTSPIEGDKEQNAMLLRDRFEKRYLKIKAKDPFGG